MAMAEGRQKAEWSRLSVALAMFANAHRDEKKRKEPFAPSDFDPFAPKKQAVRLTPAESIRSLVAALGAKEDDHAKCQ